MPNYVWLSFCELDSVPLLGSPVLYKFAYCRQVSNISGCNQQRFFVVAVICHDFQRAYDVVSAPFEAENFVNYLKPPVCRLGGHTLSS